MTKVLFFGKLGDDLGVRSTQLPAQTGVSVNTVIEQLVAANTPSWRALLTATNIITAVDKTIENDSNKVFEQIVEIAFFPPVTGG